MLFFLTVRCSLEIWLIISCVSSPSAEKNSIYLSLLRFFKERDQKQKFSRRELWSARSDRFQWGSDQQIGDQYERSQKPERPGYINDSMALPVQKSHRLWGWGHNRNERAKEETVVRREGYEEEKEAVIGSCAMRKGGGTELWGREEGGTGWEWRDGWWCVEL